MPNFPRDVVRENSRSPVRQPVRGIIDPLSTFKADLLSTEITRGIGQLTVPAIGDTDGNRLTLDFETIWKPVLAEEMRVRGLRRVQNNCSFSEDFSNAAWIKDGNASVTGTNILNFPSTFDSITQVIPTDTADTNQVLRVELSGSGTITLQIANLVDDGINTTVTLSSTPQVFTTNIAFNSTSSVVGVIGIARTFGTTATTVTANFAQCQNKTGASDPTVPDDYVSADVLSTPFHGANVDKVKYFSTINGTVVNSDIVTDITGAPIEITNPQFVQLSGNSGSFVSTPDQASFELTGAVQTFVVDVTADDYTPASILFASGQYDLGTNQRSWRIGIRTTGVLRLVISLAGTVAINIDSTVSTGLSDGTRHELKAIRTVSTGDVEFFVDDVKLGTTVSSTSGALHNSTADMTVGAILSSGSSSDEWEGKIYSAQVFDDSTLAADFNPERDSGWVNSKTFTSFTTGEVYTINGDAFLDTDASPKIMDSIKGLNCEGEAEELSGKSADLGNWTSSTTASVARDAVGLLGLPNEAETLTDSSAVSRQRRNENTPIVSGTDTYYMLLRVAYDPAPSVYPQLFIALQGGTQINQSVVFDPSDGTTEDAGFTDGILIGSFRRGDFWYVIQSLTDNNSGNNNALMGVSPAFNTDGSGTENTAAQGSTVVASAELYKTTWSASPILTTGGTTKTRLSDTDYLLDILNWSTAVDTSGSIQFELTPFFNEASGLVQGVITPNSGDSSNLLFFNQSVDKRLTLTDNTNFDSISDAFTLAATVTVKIRWGSATMRWSADGILSSSAAYDGSFNPSGAITFFKDLTQGASTKNLEIFDVDQGNSWLSLP